MNEKQLSVGDGHVTVYVDRPEGPVVGRVLVVPPFGMNAERMFPASYLLQANGFEVYRFDPRDHPGNSTGTIRTFRMSSLTEDLGVVLDHVGECIVIAISLSAASVIKALRGRTDVTAAVLLTPVVSVRYTLDKVFGYDLFQMREEGKELPAIVKPLGCSIEAERFVADCVASKTADVDDSVEDVSAWSASLTFVAGDADPWVSIAEVRDVMGRCTAAGKRVNLVTVQAASHQLYRNPVLAMTYLQAATKECLRLVGKDPDQAQDAPFSEIVSAVQSTTRRRRAIAAGEN